MCISGIVTIRLFYTYDTLGRLISQSVVRCSR